jgi:hypothetical protein
VYEAPVDGNAYLRQNGGWVGAAVKSVTNSWRDAEAVTNTLTFINGLLTSWATNTVEVVP